MMMDFRTHFLHICSPIQLIWYSQKSLIGQIASIFENLHGGCYHWNERIQLNIFHEFNKSPSQLKLFHNNKNIENGDSLMRASVIHIL